MRHAFALILLLVARTADAEDRFQSGTIAWDGKPAPRGDALMRSAMVEAHNRARLGYGSSPLAWDDALAKDAVRYARTLAARGAISHDPQTGINPRQGENLFMGTRGAYSYALMAQLWVDERRWFRKGTFPNVVTAGHWSRVGHYTQVVWPLTQRFGCAVASNRRDDVLVCRYLPAGNYFGVAMR
jgi:Cysteine-rich secretory protein family